VENCRKIISKGKIEERKILDFLRGEGLRPLCMREIFASPSRILLQEREGKEKVFRE